MKFRNGVEVYTFLHFAVVLMYRLTKTSSELPLQWI